MKNHIANPLQIRGAEQYVLQNGKGDGMKFLYIRNGLGLEVWISLDRAGDVSRVSFKGDNMGFFAPCGYVAPQYYDDRGLGFLKSFTGGFFTTCGLTAVGSPCFDDGENTPLHGTVSHIPANLDAVLEEEGGLTVVLTVRDTTIFGKKLILKRTYMFSYTENAFEMTDTVINEGSTTPYMILYHCNMGYPLLSENSVVKIPNNSVIGRDAEAEKYISNATEAEVPQANFTERCYYYDVKEKGGIASAGIYNPDIEKGVVISYDKKTLPCFTEWKMMGKNDYALGLEPGNCTPDGRDVLRKDGKLKFLESDESVTNRLRFSFVNNADDFNSVF